MLLVLGCQEPIENTDELQKARVEVKSIQIKKATKKAFQKFEASAKASAIMKNLKVQAINFFPLLVTSRGNSWH